MTEHRPTEEEFRKMFDTKMNLAVTVDGMATFYGMERLIKEIEKTIKDAAMQGEINEGDD